MRTTFICLAALAQLALSVFAEPQRIPLYRRSNGIVKAAGEQLEDGVLAGKVYIGNPPQEFTMAFDTTVGFSWVRGSRCKSENCLDRCTYYSRRSETAVSTGKKFSVDYGDACVDTRVYLDDVEFAGNSVSMLFGGAERMSGFATGFDGFLGLGVEVDALNQTEKLHVGSLMRRDEMPSTSYVTNAYNQGIVESAQFGMVTTTTDNNGFGQSGTASGQTTTPTTTDPNAGGVTSPVPSTNATVPVASGSSSAAAPAASPSDTTTTTSPPQNSGATTGPVTGGGFGFFKRTYEEAAGYLIIGGVDKSLIKGEMEYIPLADVPEGSAKNWDVCIKDANFEYTLNIKQKANTIGKINTASPYIDMPAEQADMLADILPLKLYQTSKTYGIKCSDAKNLPTLKLTIEDHIVELPPKYWIREVDADRDCCATRIRRSESEQWTLGTPFTNAFYTSFDPEAEAVGLAIKKGQPDDGLRVYRKSQH
ncbi:aspartic peptidase domain-containing protein [Fennellomyces sp. T-0311]|nr:aspartic peptidase domain-containing protein [Fennellomyces sp. T-0311]